jgi:hypothetical protein
MVGHPSIELMFADSPILLTCVMFIIWAADVKPGAAQCCDKDGAPCAD